MKNINIKTLMLMLSASVILSLTGCDSKVGDPSDSQLVGTLPPADAPPADAPPADAPPADTPPAPTHAAVVFSANTEESTISVFSMDEINGALTSFGKFNTLH